MDTVFENLKRETKLNVAFAFVLKNAEDLSSWHDYAHETSTLLERSQFVDTTEDLTKRKDLLGNTDVNEFCTKNEKT